MNNCNYNTLQYFNTIIKSAILKLDNKWRKITKKLNVAITSYKIDNDRWYQKHFFFRPLDYN